MAESSWFCLNGHVELQKWFAAILRLWGRLPLSLFCLIMKWGWVNKLTHISKGTVNSSVPVSTLPPLFMLRWALMSNSYLPMHDRGGVWLGKMSETGRCCSSCHFLVLDVWFYDTNSPASPSGHIVRHVFLTHYFTSKTSVLSEKIPGKHQVLGTSALLVGDSARGYSHFSEDICPK